MKSLLSRGSKHRLNLWTFTIAEMELDCYQIQNSHLGISCKYDPEISDAYELIVEC
jgi:hypothetical protein